MTFKQKLAVGISLIAVFGIGSLFIGTPQKIWADSPDANVHGYLWTGYDTNGNGVADGGFGWISLNCAEGGAGNTNICSQSLYGVNFDESSGLLSGHAWGGLGLGWISFDAGDVSGCPIQDSPAPNKCQGHIDTTTGKVSGWMRAVSVPKSGDNGKNGNWNGWIHLSGDFHTSPDPSGSKGVTYVQIDPTRAKLTGYAYGGTIASPSYGTEEIGWVAFETQYSNVSIVLNDPTSRGLTLTLTDGINTAVSGSNVTLLTTTPSALLTATWRSPQMVKYTACRASTIPSQNIAGGITGWDSSQILGDLLAPGYTATTGAIAVPPVGVQTDYTVTCLNSTTNANDSATVSVLVEKPVTPTFIYQISSGFSSAVTGIGITSGTDTITATPGAPLLLEWKSSNSTTYDQCTASNPFGFTAWTGSVGGINSGNGFYMSKNTTVPASPLLQPYTINCRNTTTGDTTGPFTLNVLTMVDPGQHSVVMGLSPACVTPGERFEVTWNDLGNNMLSCSPTAVSASQSIMGWLESLLFTVSNGLLPSGSQTYVAPAVSQTGMRFKMVCKGTDGLDYPDPNSAVPYYQSPMLRIVADKADCVTSPGQGKPHRIIWNEQ